MIAGIIDRLEQLLTEDDDFTAAMLALNLGRNGTAVLPQVIRSNRPLANLGQERFPCWVIELGDLGLETLAEGSSDFLAMNGRYQGVARDILLALVWHQQDADTAFAQRQGLEEPLIRLLLQNPDLDLPNVAAGYVSSIAPDRGANHPTQLWGATVRVEYSVSRDEP